MAISNNFIVPLSEKLFEKKELFFYLREWVKNELPNLPDKELNVYESLINSSDYMQASSDTLLELSTIIAAIEDTSTNDIIYRLEKVYDDYKTLETGFIDSKKKQVFINITVNCIDISKDVDILESSLLTYLRNNRLLGTNGGFRITNRKIHLRYDDIDRMKEIMIYDDNYVQITYPIIFVRSEDGEMIEKLANKYSKYATVLIDDDPDLIEDLIKSNIDVPKENTITCYSSFLDEALTKNIDDKYELIEFSEYFNFLLSNQTIIPIENTYINGLLEKEKKIHNAYVTKIKELLDEKKGLQSDIQQLKIKHKDAITLNGKTALSNGQTIMNNNVTLSNGILLQRGKENDLYPDEIKDIIISSLENYRDKYVLHDSRRADIINDILNANKSTGICKQKADEIDLIMNNFTGKTPKLIKQLEDVGFKTGGKNHIKLKWYNDNRYTYTIASTPSDVNAGKNNASDIKNMFL